MWHWPAAEVTSRYNKKGAVTLILHLESFLALFSYCDIIIIIIISESDGGSGCHTGTQLPDFLPVIHLLWFSDISLSAVEWCIHLQMNLSTLKLHIFKSDKLWLWTQKSQTSLIKNCFYQCVKKKKSYKWWRLFFHSTLRSKALWWMKF